MIQGSQMLAMHMGNELLSGGVAAVTGVVAALGVLIAQPLAARRAIRDDGRTLALMGVLGAFVFAAQMINIPILPGVSGHLAGGVLLAIILGPSAAILVMSAILIVQCLLFQDGGILALGCNIINMGIVPCVLGAGVYRLLGGSTPDAPAWRQYVAAWAACVLGVTAGAALVPLEAWSSGVLQVSPQRFLSAMIGVHVLIGLVEGAITFIVVAYIRRAHPQTLGLQAPRDSVSATPPLRPLVATLLITAALLAGVVSWFASDSPDGLEAASEGMIAENASAAVAAADALQSTVSPLPDYTHASATVVGAEPAAKASVVNGWASLAGLLGTAVTLALVYGASRVIRGPRRAACAP